MKLTLSEKEKTELLVTAIQYLGESLQVWEHLIDLDDKEYKSAKVKLIKNTQLSCQEDILAYMILKGKGITLVDDNDHDIKMLFDKKLFNKNFGKCNPLEVIKLIDDSGNYDFYTTDSVLQSLIFGEVMYG